jgi:cobyrinic acid a,c-diamide synthase
MGGLFDGEGGETGGSAAEIAKSLKVPVVLLIDVWGMTKSTAALLNGFLNFDPELRFAGFIMNRAGSKRHAQMILDGLAIQQQNLCLGYVLHDDSLVIRERHLGLVTIEENPSAPDQRTAVLDRAAENIDLDRLLQLRSADPRAAPSRRIRGKRDLRIAIARDRAFCFYYAENLTALEDAGAELCVFQPTAGQSLPEGISGLYLGGGYPESFARELASNNHLKAELRDLVDRGMPVYAECGGLMYLGRSFRGFEGTVYEMAGILPSEIMMDPKYLAIRYVTVMTLEDSPLGPEGTEARGQEFHQSRLSGPSGEPSFYRVVTSAGEEYRDGFRYNNAIGSYIHLHFASNPAIPKNFVKNCREWRSKESDK